LRIEENKGDRHDVVERFFIGLAIMGGTGLLASFGALLSM
jgi:hypothetical protein